MFRNLYAPRSEGRSRSKSPGRPAAESNDRYSTEDDERSQRRAPPGRYVASDSDGLEPETPRYEERTPDAYQPRPRKDDRKASRREEEYDDRRPTRSRKERDPYANYVEAPRPNGAGYPNGDGVNYAAFAGNGTVPGGFPGQSVKPPPPTEPRARPKSGQYAAPGGVQYAQIDPSDVQYKYNTTGSRNPSYSKAYDTVEAAPAKSSRTSVAAPRKESTRARDSEDRIKTVAEAGRRQSYQRERSPAPSNPAGLSAEQLRKSLGRLSTSDQGGMLGVGGTPMVGGKPPGSPMLQAYRGTYQMVSPLPSPTALDARRRDDDDLSDFDLSEEDSDDEVAKRIRALKKEKDSLKRVKNNDDYISPRSSGSKVDKSRTSSTSSALVIAPKGSKKKAVSFYDPGADAEKIADGLKGNHRQPDVKPLLKILPWLTTDEIISLKIAYKNYAKINGQGINLSKHIKARIPNNLGKVLYATSLGQYESDAYWANCFYQSGAARRELIIESLIGRTNQQIREIKDAFKDKKYDDDLEKCLKAELNADKFRDAILLALQERRMPDGLGLDMRLVHEDGMDLHDALHVRGSESSMVKIIMLRSDDHLKEVLRYYEKSYKRNFARDMITTSQNLVVSLTIPSNLP